MYSVSPVSLLDTDLYKFTMQQAVLQKFPAARCTYRFKNRSLNMLFNQECIDLFKSYISRLSNLGLTSSEHKWLQYTCPYFTPEYLSYLSQYRFKPDQVNIEFIPSQDDTNQGSLNIEVAGPWVETILWEVPLMSLLSEAYFKTTDCDWDYEGQEELAYEKCRDLLQSGILFSEFGTRRRRSLHTQDIVISGFQRAVQEFTSSSTGKLLGTSNVYLAYKHGLKPVGTIAHEWFMAMGASLGYEHVNAKALDLWHEVYGNNNLISLTDTFTTEAFFKDFSADRARLWTGIRQDSGDPFVYAPRAKSMYQNLGVDPSERTIVFSDSLSVKLAKQLKQQCDDLGMKATFGIGTHFTNDFHTKSSGGKEKSKALNIVIKLASIDGKPCVKLSDEPMKHTGDPESIQKVKEAFGLST
ncbi:nicotinate phosphoribosyltransferase [Ramaria rubella]|nr:nicotinate phosphoribosyltransferase [Ramaria rubella]